MKSTKIRIVLLLVFPILIASFLVLLSAKGQYIQSINASYQKTHRVVSWATLQTNGGCYKIILDNLERIWTGGGCEGLHVFNGARWLNTDSASESYYSDFALDQEGRVWANPSLIYANDEPRLLFYDGKKWEAYPRKEIEESSQVEVDTKGRVWVTTSNVAEGKSGFLLFEKNTWRTISNESLGLPEDKDRLIKSDNEGRIWIVYGLRSGDSGGLYVFDGTKLNQILDNGKRLKDISDITFDHQNNLWIATVCGSIREFTNNVWKTYLDEPANCDTQVNGIYVDNQERIWIWGRDYPNEYVGVFDKGMWRKLTQENSGIAGGQIYGLVVDKLDRAWVLTNSFSPSRTGEVSMISVKDIQIIPQGVVDRPKQAEAISKFLDGIRSLLPVILAVLWLIILLKLDIWRSVRIILVVGLLTAPVFRGRLGDYYLGPGGFTMISGLFGGFVGSLFGRRADKKVASSPNLEAKWGNRLGIIFLLLGLALGFIWYLIIAFTIEYY